MMIGPAEMMLLMLLLGLIPLLLAIFAFIDLAQRPMETAYKIIWVLVILLMPCLGSIAYLIVGPSMR